VLKPEADSTLQAGVDCEMLLELDAIRLELEIVGRVPLEFGATAAAVVDCSSQAKITTVSIRNPVPNRNHFIRFLEVNNFIHPWFKWKTVL
jgi:hypothetical protein